MCFICTCWFGIIDDLFCSKMAVYPRAASPKRSISRIVRTVFLNSTYKRFCCNCHTITAHLMKNSFVLVTSFRCMSTFSRKTRPYWYMSRKKRLENTTAALLANHLILFSWLLFCSMLISRKSESRPRFFRHSTSASMLVELAFVIFTWTVSFVLLRLKYNRSAP